MNVLDSWSRMYERGSSRDKIIGVLAGWQVKRGFVNRLLLRAA